MNDREKMLDRVLILAVKEVLDFCEDKKRVFIYGAGTVAAQLKEYLEEFEIAIDASIVRNPENEEKPNYCISIVDYNYHQGDGIIIGTRESLHQDITIDLINQGIPIDAIFSQKLFWPLLSGVVSGCLSGEFSNTNTSNGVYFDKYVELNDIGLKRKTDKNSDNHNYLRKYEMFLNSFKHKRFTLMELGVFKGASIRTWSDYFSEANVIGVDIDPACMQYEGENIRIEIKNAGNWNDLHYLSKYEPEVIIDDASHKCSDMIKALLFFFPRLPHGGYILWRIYKQALQIEWRLNIWMQQYRRLKF